MSVETKEELLPFTVKEDCIDEVEFHFTDDKRLYVSKGMLVDSSPVFKKMFSSKFEEGTTGIVNMETKNYDDVLEFLRVLNPGEHKPVTDKTMFIVLELAEEYQVHHLIEKCKQLMFDTIELNSLRNESDYCLRKQAAALKILLDVLSRCVVFSYSELHTKCLETISRFGSMIFTSSNSRCNMSFHHGDCHQKSAELIKSVKVAFEDFEADMQIKILKNRLLKIDDNKLK